MRVRLCFLRGSDGDLQDSDHGVALEVMQGTLLQEDIRLQSSSNLSSR